MAMVKLDNEDGVKKMIDEKKQLLDRLSQTLLCESICEDIEKIDQLPIMLKQIDYVEDKSDVIKSAVECEIFHADSLRIICSQEDRNQIYIFFEMPFILSVWSEESSLLRIQAIAKGRCSIPNIEQYHWENIDFDFMNKKEILQYKKLVNMIKLYYSDIECDDMRII